MKAPLLLLLPLLCGGCISNGSLARLVKELAKDPATSTVRVTTVYGTLTFTRTNPTTNTAPHTLSPDGTVTIR